MLNALKSHPRMREMRVGYNRQNTTQDLATAGLACLLIQKALGTKSLCRLEMLDLNNVRIGDEGMQRMAVALGSNNVLKRLDVCFNSIGLDGMRALSNALAQNQGLESLDIRDNEAGDDGAEALSLGLQTNYTLRKLKIARNEIGSRGAIALRSAMKGNPKLVLDFGNSGASSYLLQGLVNRTPRMCDLQFLRESMRENASAANHTSNFFSY